MTASPSTTVGAQAATLWCQFKEAVVHSEDVDDPGSRFASVFGSHAAQRERRRDDDPLEVWRETLGKLARHVAVGSHESRRDASDSRRRLILQTPPNRIPDGQRADKHRSCAHHAENDPERRTPVVTKS